MKKYRLFIGIDVSKSWIDVSLTVDGQKSIMVHKRFDNKIKSFNKMLVWIGKFSKQQQLERSKWLFCMEHTGVYSMPLCSFLQEQQLSYVLEVALRIRYSLGLTRGKDDKADSKDIARYAYLHREELQPSQLPSQALLELKNLISFRGRLLKQRNALKTPVGEMKQFMPKELYQTVLEDTQELVHLISQKIKKVEKQMKQIVKENLPLKEAYDLATSVKGINLICGVNLLVSTNCFKAFDNGRKFSCYIGIAPFSHRSGSSVYLPDKVSQLGQKKLKALLTNAVMSAVQHDKELKAYYERKLAEGKNKFSVLNAVKNKLVNRVFAVVKRGLPYVERNTYA